MEYLDLRTLLVHASLFWEMLCYLPSIEPLTTNVYSSPSSINVLTFTSMGDSISLITICFTWRISIHWTTIGRFTTGYLTNFPLFHQILCLIGAWIIWDIPQYQSFPCFSDLTMVYFDPLAIAWFNKYIISYPILWHFHNRSSIYPFIGNNIPETLLSIWCSYHNCQRLFPCPDRLL